MLSRGELEKSVKKISAKNELVLLSLNVQTNELVLLKSYVRRSSAKNSGAAVYCVPLLSAFRPDLFCYNLSRAAVCPMYWFISYCRSPEVLLQHVL